MNEEMLIVKIMDALARNMVVYDSDSTTSDFTKRLIAILKSNYRRNTTTKAKYILFDEEFDYVPMLLYSHVLEMYPGLASEQTKDICKAPVSSSYAVTIFGLKLKFIKGLQQLIDRLAVTSKADVHSFNKRSNCIITDSLDNLGSNILGMF